MKLYNLRHLVFAAAALCATAPLAAQEVWIGRPTIGDHMRHHIGQLAMQRQHAMRSKAQFNAELEQARRDFFATAQKPGQRAEAEERFAKMLFGKDYIYMVMLITEGTGEASRKRSELMHKFSGGDIDGGIAPSTRAVFDAWVNAVRTNLGARSANEPVFVFDAGRLEKAIEASAGSYSAYKTVRDKFEIDRFTTGKSVRAARLGPQGYRLHEQRHGALDVMADMRADLLGQTRPLRSRLSEIARSGQEVLRCAYGPKSDYADGTPQYEHIFFWFRQAPSDIDELLAADTARGMARLRTRTALAKCPENSGAAKATFDGGESAGSAHAAKPPKQLEDEKRAAMQAAGEERRAAAAAEREAQAARIRAPHAAAERTLQTQRDEMEARKQAQRHASQQRQCAAIDAQIERMRSQMQAMPPVHAARRIPQLEAMQRNRAERCG